jgi:hypothetical protein
LWHSSTVQWWPEGKQMPLCAHGRGSTLYGWICQEMRSAAAHWSQRGLRAEAQIVHSAIYSDEYIQPYTRALTFQNFSDNARLPAVLGSSASAVAAAAAQHVAAGAMFWLSVVLMVARCAATASLPAFAPRFCYYCYFIILLLCCYYHCCCSCSCSCSCSCCNFYYFHYDYRYYDFCQSLRLLPLTIITTTIYHCYAYTQGIGPALL